MRGSPAPEIHHLWPLMTISSVLGSSWIDVRMLVASELAIPFSVMANDERVLPSRRGLSHFSCCAGFPYLARTSASRVAKKHERHDGNRQDVVEHTIFFR